MTRFQLYHLINVLIVFLAFYETSWSEQVAERADCLRDGVLRRHGEEFVYKCNRNCRCENGKIRCRSTCPFDSLGQGCRILRKIRNCCYESRCANATRKDACNTNQGVPPAAALLHDQLPWLFRISVQNGSQNGNCVAVLFDAVSLVASPDCLAGSDSRIVYPQKLVDLEIFHSMQIPVRKGKAQVARLGVTERGLSQREQGITSDEAFHEINVAPFNETCLRSDCALHIEAYDPVENKFKIIHATPAAPDQCRINATDLDKGVKCLEIRSQDYPNCVNLAGAAVSIILDDYFFLKGFVAQSPFLEKNSNGCDSQLEKFKRYYDFCSDFVTTFRDL